MSKSRRSIIRSSLARLRQLWSRQEKGRREMRRSLGSSFELLEPRLALTISAPLPPAFPSTGAHIHPILQIYLNGQQLVIPANIGTQGEANPHTHDTTGTLHVGEGPTSSGSGNATLKDLFDVWRSTTLTAPSVVNPNAIFDTDATDGTPSPRIMDQVVDATHVLRMYVKEAGIDAAPELEYDSSAATPVDPAGIPGNGTRPELYVPRDGDQVFIKYDSIDTPAFAPIASQTVLGGAPTWLGIDGFGSSGGPLTYTVSSSNPSLLTATLAPTTDKSLVLNVSGGVSGQMTYHLFDRLAPRTTSHIESLVNSGTFAVGAQFYRIARNGDGSDFVIQGGPANPTSSLGQFDDEYNTDLQFTTPGLLAMAKSSDDTNDSQIFVTGQPTRFLDFQHSIFGVLTTGETVRQAIQHAQVTSGTSTPTSAINIASAQIVNDNQNTALELKAAEGASGQADVTVEAHDGQGHTFSQTFHVTITPDTANSAPFLVDATGASLSSATQPPIHLFKSQSIPIQLHGKDAENDPIVFQAALVDPSLASQVTVNANQSTGAVTITPNSTFVGGFTVAVSTNQATATTTADRFDTQMVQVGVGLDLDASSDTGSSSSDNVTNASTLHFTVFGVTNGATVTLKKGSTILGTATASGDTATFTISKSQLTEGANVLTATQTVNSVDSTTDPLTVTLDTTPPPAFTSTPPTIARVGEAISYDAQNPAEGTTGFKYSLSAAPTGATINATTGVLSWTPTAAQAGSNAFAIVLTDAAGNSVTQPVTIKVYVTDFSLKLTTTSGAPLTSLAVNQEFVLHFFAQDVRPQPHGMFTARTDITFDPNHATATGTIQYVSPYTNNTTGTVSSGLINEAGALGPISEPGGVLSEIFNIKMKATAQGLLTFATDAADDPNNETLMFQFGQGGSTPVTADQIRFGTASIDVGGAFSAVNDTFSTPEDTAITIDPLANDVSNGGTTNTKTITTLGPTDHGGTVSITADNQHILYTPAANFNGTETFTYTVKNQDNETHTASVTMTVTAVNDPPPAVNDTFTSILKNSSNNVLDVLANDNAATNPDTGETLRISGVGTATGTTATTTQGGTVTLTNGQVKYTPKAGFVGNDTFTYTVSDRAAGVQGAQTATATATVNVSGINAVPDTATVQEDSSATTINVLSNDDTGDPNIPNSALTITDKGTPDHGGSVTIAADGKSVSYQPAANFQGTEKFTYTISDGQGHTGTSSVTVTVNNVNDPPVAVTDTLTAFMSTATTFDVLANDIAANPDPNETLTIDSIATQPTHGTAEIVNGKVKYTPASGYTGSDSFTYLVKDSTDTSQSATGTANINVLPFQPSTLSGFVYFDTNNNGIKDAGEVPIVGITITLTGTPTAGDTTPVSRTAKTSDNGSYTFDNVAPGNNYVLTESQPVFVINGKVTAGSQGGTVSTNKITIATLAQGTTGTGNNFGERGRLLSTISLRDMFSSTSRSYARAAFDSSGNELWHTVQGPAWTGFTGNAFSLINNKTQIKVNGTGPDGQAASRTLNVRLPVYLTGQASGNRLYYVPGGLRTITPGATNLAPIAVTDSYNATEDSTLTVTAANNLLKNDSDPEGKQLKAILGAQGTKGTVSLHDDGTFTYSPNPNANGIDTFTYRVSDGPNQSPLTTVTINIAPLNDPPSFTVPAGAAAVNEDAGAQTVNNFATNISLGPSDESNQTPTFNLSVASHTGTLDFDVAPAIDATGKLTYTPKANTNGTATISVVMTDSGSSTAPNVNASPAQTFTITVNAVNDPPQRLTPSTLTPISVAEDSVTTAQTLGLASLAYTPGPTDEASQTPLTYRLVAVPSFINVFDGSNPVTANTDLSLAQLQGLTFTTKTDTVGQGSLIWTVKDASGGANDTLSETLSVTVTPVNDAPVRTAPTNLTNISADEDSADASAVSLGLSGLTYSAGSSDENDTQQLTYQITGIPSFIHVFKTDGTTEVHVNDALSLDDLKGLKYETVGNQFGTGSVTWAVQDNGTPPLSLNETLGITVRAIADTPSVTGTATNEDIQTTSDLVISRNAADDGEVTHFQITGISGGHLFKHDGTTEIHNNDFITFAEGNAGLKFTPDLNSVSDGSFVVRASTSSSAADLGGNAVTATINVTPVNDVPARTAGTLTAINVDEDSSTTGNSVTLGLSGLNYGPGGGSDEAANQHLTYTITAIPSFISVFKEDGTTPVNTSDTLTLAELQGLTYRTNGDKNGAGVITWTVNDGGGTANGGVDTLTESLSIAVNAVNDPPTFLIPNDPPAITESAGPQTVPSFATAISPGPSDESSQLLVFTVTQNGSSLTFTAAPHIDDQGTLTYTVADGSSGTATFDVVLTDNGQPAASSGTLHFTITVNPAGGQGEGESAPLSVNDAALLAYLTGEHTSLEVPDGTWQSAVDQLMTQLA